MLKFLVIVVVLLSASSTNSTMVGCPKVSLVIRVAWYCVPSFSLKDTGDVYFSSREFSVHFAFVKYTVLVAVFTDFPQKGIRPTTIIVIIARWGREVIKEVTILRQGCILNLCNSRGWIVFEVWGVTRYSKFCNWVFVFFYVDYYCLFLYIFPLEV